MHHARCSDGFIDSQPTRLRLPRCAMLRSASLVCRAPNLCSKPWIPDPEPAITSVPMLQNHHDVNWLGSWLMSKTAPRRAPSCELPLERRSHGFHHRQRGCCFLFQKFVCDGNFDTACPRCVAHGCKIHIGARSSPGSVHRQDQSYSPMRCRVFQNELLASYLAYRIAVSPRRRSRCAQNSLTIGCCRPV